MPRRPTAAVGLQLRFSEQLRRKIEQAAKKNDRSMNAEIVARLEESFSRPPMMEELKLATTAAIREFIIAPRLPTKAEE